MVTVDAEDPLVNPEAREIYYVTEKSYSLKSIQMSSEPANADIGEYIIGFEVTFASIYIDWPDQVF